MKFLGVAPVAINASVGAQPDFYVLGEGTLKRLMHGGDGGARFGFNGGGHVDAAIELLLNALDGHQGGNEVGAVLVHHVERFVVEKAAVFNRIDACTDGALGGLRTVGMG